jgi:hypothetical protein
LCAGCGAAACYPVSVGHTVCHVTSLFLRFLQFRSRLKEYLLWGGLFEGSLLFHRCLLVHLDPQKPKQVVMVQFFIRALAGVFRYLAGSLLGMSLCIKLVSWQVPLRKSFQRSICQSGGHRRTVELGESCRALPCTFFSVWGLPLVLHLNLTTIILGFGFWSG